MKRSSPQRVASELSKSLNHQLNMYALAAGASGVGLLALAPLAEARIIYTPAHVNVTGAPLPIDLNHDGNVDFYLIFNFPRYSSHPIKLSVCPHVSHNIFYSYCSTSFLGANVVRASDSKSAEYAAAMRKGDKVQRGRFAKGKVVLGSQTVRKVAEMWRGPWVNGGKGVTNRYLGLKFKIKGRSHFGWARITVTITRSTISRFHINATLTGYAYETIPGKGIIAGQTKGPEDEPTVSHNSSAPEPATLGMLALGVRGLSIWRREESVR